MRATEETPVTPKRLLILGSTGSIGVNTLEVVDLHPEKYHVFALTASTNVQVMFAQCCKYQPHYAVMASADHAKALASQCAAQGLATVVLSGAPALVEVAQDARVDVVMAAIVGAAGLPACMAAALAGKRILLANKEALVVGGQLFLDAVQRGGATLIPIDSEHSAIFQSLPPVRETWDTVVQKLILTGSGGPFRTREPSTFATVTPSEACAHPNWVMGRKISVDSATMMNKALEVIEASYLFAMPPERLEVLIHPQSIIHSMVQYVDGSVLAQLGTPDMKAPIAYGLAWPTRHASGAPLLDFAQISALSFEPIDTPNHQQRYPCLPLAWQVLAASQGSTAVLNAANEVAVEAFLAGQIRFDQIYQLNLQTLEQVTVQPPDSLEAVLEIDRQARACARASIARWAH